MGDTKPFTEVVSHFVDAKFYMDEDMVVEVIPIEVHSTNKAHTKKRRAIKIPSHSKE